jgi:polyisoprenoid-binding protein YceI
MKTLAAFALAVVLGASFAPAAPAQQLKQFHLHLDPAQTEVHYTLKDTIHTVHGTFRMSAGDISFNPQTGEATGKVTVDTGSGASGNDTRDGKMKKDFLEVPSFPIATYEVEHVNGFDPQKPSQKITVNGTMTLHGAKHALVMEFDLGRDGQATVAATHFMIPYVAWGIKDPSIPFVKVEKEVLMEITARGTLSEDK